MRNPDSGLIEAICGTMFSGKSEELIRRFKRLPLANQHFALFKPLIDTRSGANKVKSKSGSELDAIDIPVDDPKVLFDKLREREEALSERCAVVGLDEAQFFPRGSEMTDVLVELKRRGYRVIVAGLDLDFRGEPFGIMPDVLALADEITKLYAVCMKCGSHFARFPQRLIDGKLASSDAPQIVVGGQDLYEARCSKCFIPPR